METVASGECQSACTSSDVLNPNPSTFISDIALASGILSCHLRFHMRICCMQR